MFTILFKIVFTILIMPTQFVINIVLNILGQHKLILSGEAYCNMLSNTGLYIPVAIFAALTLLHLIKLIKQPVKSPIKIIKWSLIYGAFAQPYLWVGVLFLSIFNGTTLLQKTARNIYQTQKTTKPKNWTWSNWQK